jgi:hypothetical protein
MEGFAPKGNLLARHTIANGDNRAKPRIAVIYMEIKYHSESSRSISVIFGRSLNQRVGGSSPARLTTSLHLLFVFN